MAVPIKEAAIMAKVSRSTVHRWIKGGYIPQNEKTRMVEVGDVLKLMGGERKSSKGRAAGWAGKDKEVELSKVSDLGLTLEKAVVVLSGVLNAMSPAQRSWVKATILARIDDPNLVIRTEVPITASQLAIVETKQEQAWNNVLVRDTLSPNVLASAPDIRDLGQLIKRLGILEKEGLPLPEELRAALFSVSKPCKQATPASQSLICK
jgi:hypothetical protein